jgi:hypothetical protein
MRYNSAKLVSAKISTSSADRKKSLAMQFHRYHFESRREFILASKIARQTAPANGCI